MLFDNDGAYPPLSLWFAQQLGLLEGGSDPSLIGLSAAEISGQPNQQASFAPTSSMPIAYTFNAGDFSVVLIGGTDRLDQAANLVSAWSQRVPNDTFPGVPTSIFDACFRLTAQLTVAGRTPRDRIFFVGHSLGGAMAQVCAGMWRRNRTGVSVLSVSFGSPRIGDHRFAATQRDTSNTRWMNERDPVPTLPPSLPSSISFALGLGTEVISRWDSFVHGGGGIVLDHDGNPSPMILPPLSTIGANASLVDWAYKAMTDASSEHSISTYYDRLSKLVQRSTPPQVTVIREAPAEEPRRNDRHTQNAQVDAYIANIVHNGVAQQQPRLVVPPNRPFKTVKFEGLWWVTFGDRLVAASPTRKRAGRMAVIGNDFLRRVQRQAAVDVEAMKQLLAEYLDAASIPDNGFNPPIKPFPLP